MENNAKKDNRLNPFPTYHCTCVHAHICVYVNRYVYMYIHIYTLTWIYRLAVSFNDCMAP